MREKPFEFNIGGKTIAFLFLTSILTILGYLGTVVSVLSLIHCLFKVAQDGPAPPGGTQTTGGQTENLVVNINDTHYDMVYPNLADDLARNEAHANQSHPRLPG